MIDLSCCQKLLSEDRLDEVHALCLTALEENENQNDAWYWLAKLAQRSGLEQEAIDFFSKALELAPGRSMYVCELARHYERLGLRKQAIELLELNLYAVAQTNLVALLREVCSRERLLPKAYQVIAGNYWRIREETADLFQWRTLSAFRSARQIRHFPSELSQSNLFQLDTACAQINLVSLVAGTGLIFDKKNKTVLCEPVSLYEESLPSMAYPGLITLGNGCCFIVHRSGVPRRFEHAISLLGWDSSNTARALLTQIPRLARLADQEISPATVLLVDADVSPFLRRLIHALLPQCGMVFVPAGDAVEVVCLHYASETASIALVDIDGNRTFPRDRVNQPALLWLGEQVAAFERSGTQHGEQALLGIVRMLATGRLSWQVLTLLVDVALKKNSVGAWLALAKECQSAQLYVIAFKLARQAFVLSEGQIASLCLACELAFQIGRKSFVRLMFECAWGQGARESQMLMQHMLEYCPEFRNKQLRDFSRWRSRITHYLLRLCDIHGAKQSRAGQDMLQELSPARVWQVSPLSTSESAANVALPVEHQTLAQYTARLQHVSVVGGSDVVLDLEAEECISDSLFLHAPDAKSSHGFNLLLISHSDVLVGIGPNSGKSVKHAISFLGLGWCNGNYAHWLLEKLPRFYWIDRLDLPGDTVLLIECGLPDSIYESLKLFWGNRPILHVMKGESVAVDFLFYLSNSADIFEPKPGHVFKISDFSICVEALTWMRQAILHQSGASEINRRLYLPRLNAVARKVTNEEDVILALRSFHFEPFEPEKCQFIEQVRWFSSCQFAAGSAGAAFANLFFMPEGSKAIIFTRDDPQINYWFFHYLAEISGVSLVFVFSEIDDAMGDINGVHSDICVDVDMLTNVVNKMLI